MATKRKEKIKDSFFIYYVVIVLHYVYFSVVPLFYEKFLSVLDVNVIRYQSVNLLTVKGMNTTIASLCAFCYALESIRRERRVV